MDFKTIVITGASSGIGAARALALPGRQIERLEAVALACRATGATCRTASLDVSEADAL